MSDSRSSKSKSEGKGTCPMPGDSIYANAPSEGDEWTVKRLDDFTDDEVWSSPEPPSQFMSLMASTSTPFDGDNERVIPPTPSEGEMSCSSLLSDRDSTTSPTTFVDHSDCACHRAIPPTCSESEAATRDNTSVKEPSEGVDPPIEIPYDVPDDYSWPTSGPGELFLFPRFQKRVRVRIVSPLEGHFTGDILQYKEVGMEVLYQKLDTLLQTAYSRVEVIVPFHGERLAGPNDDYELSWCRTYCQFLKQGDRVVFLYPVEGKYVCARGKLISKLGAGDQIAVVEFMDEIRPRITVRTTDLFPYDVPKDLDLPPRVKKMRLAYLDHYRGFYAFNSVINSVCADAFDQEFFAHIMGDEKDLIRPAVLDNKKFQLPLFFPVGVNGFILERLIDAIGAPELPNKDCSVEGAILKHVLPGNGNACLHLPNPALKHLDHILQSIEEKHFSSEEIMEPSTKEVYLYKLKSGQYARVKVTSSPSFVSFEGNVIVTFLDHGIDHVEIPMKKLLQPSSGQLQYFLQIIPPQAVLVHLSGVSKVNDKLYRAVMDEEQFTKTRQGFVLKVLGPPTASTSTIRNLAPPFVVSFFPEVELIYQSQSGRVRSLNEQLSFDGRNIGVSNQMIRKSCRVASSALIELAHVEVSPFISYNCIIWSGPNEKIEYLRSGETYNVLLKYFNAGSSVILSGDRISLRSEMESDMTEFYGSVGDTMKFPFHAKTDGLFAAKWYGRIVRVKPSANWFDIHRMINETNNSSHVVDVWMIDYGEFIENVSIYQMFPLDPRFCRYPPFAVEVAINIPISEYNIKADKAAQPTFLKHFNLDGEAFLDTIFHEFPDGMKCQVKVESLRPYYENYPVLTGSIQILKLV